MKQKLFTLLTLLVLCVTGAWADPITWTFKSSNIKNGASFAGNSTNTFVADNGTSELVFKGNSNDNDKLQALSPNVEVGDVTYDSELYINSDVDGSKRYLSFTGLSGKGTLTIVFGDTNKNKNATVTDKTASPESTVGTLDDGTYQKVAKDITISTSLNPEHTYYITGKIRQIYAIIWTPAIATAATDPTFTPNGGDIDGGSSITLSSDGTIYYQWKDEATALTTESTGWIEGSTLKAPNVTATKILYAYATNGEDLESNVVSKSFNISKVTLAAGLSYTTPSYSIYEGQTFTAPTLNNPNSLTGVSYTLTGDEGVASVNSETGAVTLLGGTGEVRITASTAAQGDYAAGSAYYDLEVKSLPTLTAVTEKTWDFSNKTTFPNQTLTSLFYSDNLIINAVSDKSVTIASSRIELGGAGSATARNITIKVAPKSRINVTCVSSSSGTPRTLNVDKDEFGTNLGTIAAPGSSATNHIDYTGSTEATLIIYSTNGGIHVSQIQVEHLSSAPTITTQPVGATYNLNEVADALTIAAEATNEGALSYQWYSNTTGTAAPESDTAVGTGASYTPSTSVSGTTYFYCVVTEEGNDEKATSDIVAIKVVDLGELIVTLQPATIPSGDTAYPSNTFSANGFTLAASNANFWNSVLAKYPRIFKAQKDVTFTITAPSYATIKSIKILGTSNNDDNTASIDAGSGATAVTSTTLKKRKDYTGSDNPELSEIILAVDAPSAGNSISFTTKSQQVRFYVEIYGTGTAPDQNISATKEYSTFCSAYDLDFTNVDGLEAYVVSAINESSATISKVNKVPASTGLILKKTANIGTASNFSVSVPTSTDDMGTNNLVGVLADTDMTSVENAYILSNGKFYECSGGTLAAGKAYLVAAAWASGDAREYSIVVDGSDDHTTSIDSINTQHPSTDSQRYNLAGQKVSENYKGIVIVNGKKYIKSNQGRT